MVLAVIGVVLVSWLVVDNEESFTEDPVLTTWITAEEDTTCLVGSPPSIKAEDVLPVENMAHLESEITHSQVVLPHDVLADGGERSEVLYVVYRETIVPPKDANEVVITCRGRRLQARVGQQTAEFSEAGEELFYSILPLDNKDTIDLQVDRSAKVSNPAVCRLTFYK